MLVGMLPLAGSTPPRTHRGPLQARASCGVSAVAASTSVAAKVPTWRRACMVVGFAERVPRVVGGSSRAGAHVADEERRVVPLAAVGEPSSGTRPTGALTNARRAAAVRSQ